MYPYDTLKNNLFTWIFIFVISLKTQIFNKNFGLSTTINQLLKQYQSNQRIIILKGKKIYNVKDSLYKSSIVLFSSKDQQQRSSSNNISLSPFRSNNNLEKLLVLLVSKNFFCTNKLFSLKLAIGYPEKSAYISTLGHLNLSYIHIYTHQHHE